MRDETDVNTEDVPNPGSDEAQALGCTCPVLDNGHGRGYMGQEGIFVITGGCPLHDNLQTSDTLTKIKEHNHAGEPVAWRWRWNDGLDSEWLVTDTDPREGATATRLARLDLGTLQPLYAHPAPPSDELRETSK